MKKTRKQPILAFQELKLNVMRKDKFWKELYHRENQRNKTSQKQGCISRVNTVNKFWGNENEVIFQKN